MTIDEKAGFCTSCRAGSHSLCGSAKCTCPDLRKHRHRPGFGAVPSPSAVTERAVESTPTTASSGPTFRLVKKDPPAPPAKPKKLTLAERLTALLADVDGTDCDWYSVAEAATPRGASQLRSRCSKVMPGWDFRAGGVEVFARRTQETA